MTRTVLLAGLLVLAAGCRDEPGFPLTPLLGEPDVTAARASEIDSLAAAGAHVSVSGTVLEQEHRELLLDDGTGLILIELPEEPPLLTHQRLLAAGQLVEQDGTPRLRANEWLYDSTAVPVHSD